MARTLASLVVVTTMVLWLSPAAGADRNRTQVSLVNGQWHLNGKVTYRGAAAEGLLMNVRMVNATFEDRRKPDFEAEANTDRFIARISDYAAQGVNAFTLCLQGGMPGYEDAVNSAFEPDGGLRPAYLARVERVIRACDRYGVAVILGLYYQRQSAILRDEAAVRIGVVNAARWVRQRGFENVLLEIANEYPHQGFAHALIRDPKGQASLIRLAKDTAPGLLVSASGYGDGKVHAEVAEAADFLLAHWNGTPVEQIPARVKELKRFGKPIVCNEDDKTGSKAVAAIRASITSGAGYGLMLKIHNQTFPFHFDGAADDPVFYAELRKLTTVREQKADVDALDYLPPLRVSDNHRFLVKESGQPFFWLGDTSWHMFGKSAREEATHQPPVSRYFASRAAKGFTVIQSVIVRSPDGGSSANAYGFEPFESGDWARPRVRPGPNDDYWDHVDWCVAEAKRNKLYLAALPCWLSAIVDNNPMVRDPRVAYRYGHFLGTRYGKEPHLIWVLGGDAWQKGRNVDQPARLALVRAQAEGIADAVNGVDQFDGQADWRMTLMTFHPPGGDHSSSEWLHAEPWLDFNMIQTTTRFNFENWRTVAKDYALLPPKPTFDAEVAYEDSLSLRQTEPQDRRIRPWDARRAAYWNVFAGSLGHTYGHRSFIGWIRQGETYRYGAHIPWYESLDAPGAFQMGYLRRLMESRPFLTRVPDQSVIAGDTLTGEEHLQATRDSGGTYAMVYSPSGRPFQVRMDKIAGTKVKAWWFNPRTGEATAVGEFANAGEREFTPPTSGEDNDWVLALDDAAKNLRAPGLVKDTSYLNDTAAGPDGHGVFVTDMGARDKIMGPDGLWPLDSPEARALPHLGRIYHITLDGQVRLAVNATPEMACPNGVCAPALDRLLIAEFFHGNLLQARGGKVEQLNTGFRGADGIECAKSGEIFVSSWTQGMVWKLDQHGQNPKVLVEGLQSAADFYLDERARLLLVPDMKAGTIVYVPLE